MVDNILFMTMAVDEDGNEQRVIHLRETMQWQAGSTFEGITPIIPLDAEAYKKAITNAIGLLDETQLKDEKESVGMEEQQELNFDELMKEAKELGVQFHKAGRMGEVQQIVDEVFGTGKKLTEATKKQVQQLFIAVLKMKEVLGG
jgi:hypothetical protein